MCLDVWRAVCAVWQPRVENSRELVKLRLRPQYRLRELQRSKRVRGWNELSRAVHSLEVNWLGEARVKGGGLSFWMPGMVPMPRVGSRHGYRWRLIANLVAD